jgi:microcystin-dependent protein
MNPLLGQIIMFAGNFAPRNWAFCQGQILQISEYTALFSILGTTYGGNGRTTFALPDLRGRAPIHSGRAPGLSTYNLGEKGGLEQVVLNIAQMPEHSHTTGDIASEDQHILLSSAAAVNETPKEGDVPAVANFPGSITAQNVKSFGPPTNVVNGQTISGNAGLTISNTGGGASHENRQPYLVMNYIICIIGDYPPRN